MTWTDQIFAYCERGGDPSFWAEPLNAASNSAFIIAALMALFHREQQPSHQRDKLVFVLIALVFAIGIGSFLFHTFATRWARIADSAPIACFMVAYLGYALRRYLELNPIIAATGVAIFLAFVALLVGVPCGEAGCLNGSLGYLPALASLLMTGCVLWYRRHQASYSMIGAGSGFALALVFRTIDSTICQQTLVQPGWRLGTHALWHVLNAIVIYVLLRAAILYGTPDRLNTHGAIHKQKTI